MSIFTDSDKQSFEDNGFLVIPKMYSSEEIGELSAWVNHLASIKPQKGKEMIYYDDSLKQPGQRIINRIEYFAYRDTYIKGLLFSDKLLKTVGTLLEDEPVLFKEKFNFKLPGGGGFKPHQDIQPGWDEYASYFLSVLIVIDDNIEANGCLELAKGHHKRGWIGRPFEPLEGAELEGIVFEKYPMQAGDIVIFDCYVPHQSEPNLSDKPRRNLYLTYNRKSDGDHREKYFAAKRKSYPPDNEREPGKSYGFRV